MRSCVCVFVCMFVNAFSNVCATVCVFAHTTYDAHVRRFTWRACVSVYECVCARYTSRVDEYLCTLNERRTHTHTHTPTSNTTTRHNHQQQQQQKNANRFSHFLCALSQSSTQLSSHDDVDGIRPIQQWQTHSMHTHRKSHT